ncbi:MAG TPA: hypothetical protein VNE82_05990 [Candidatus Binataceae bacterium]|nr:hypothetical protein [Candidatus Binataceae bacterium]
MRRRFAIAVLAGIMCTAMALGGCTRGRTGIARYFPLEPGMAWTFRFIGSTGATGEMTTVNQAPRQVFGFTAVPQRNMGGNNKTYTEFYADDGQGIRHIAIDESEGLRSRLSDHSYVIKLPISVGTTWREIDRSFDGTLYDATTKIESVNDKITVPAGTFSGCLRIKSTGFASATKGTARAPGVDSGLRLVADGNVSIEDYYWLAPGVGPVKATHQESQGEGPMAESIGFTMELEHLKQ